MTKPYMARLGFQWKVELEESDELLMTVQHYNVSRRYCTFSCNDIEPPVRMRRVNVPGKRPG